MKIAIPTKNNQVDNHFGHCQFFSVYEVRDAKIITKSNMDSPLGCGCKSNLTDLLNEEGVTKMLAGNMGEGALNKLQNAGIEVLRGCHGNVDDVLKAYLSGFLVDSGELCSSQGKDGEHNCSH